MKTKKKKKKRNTIIRLPIIKSIRFTPEEEKKFQEIADLQFKGSFSDFIRYSGNYYERKWNQKDYEKEVEDYINQLERDKSRIMEERGFKLEVEEVSKAYRKKIQKSRRKTIRK
tara:strand:- start:416 stop:757 length:342 start_codon:yes stop_codon:yes gene_type:complete